MAQPSYRFEAQHSDAGPQITRLLTRSPLYSLGMSIIEPAENDEDLRTILDLQARNFPEVVEHAALAQQGLVSVRHDLERLAELHARTHARTPHMVARHH